MTPETSPRSRVTLNGTWQRSLNGTFLEDIEVPSSRRPSGRYELNRSVLLPPLDGGRRVIIRFEGITFHGRLSVNGAELGTMGPYVPYEFDVTGQVRPGTNDVSVVIGDLAPQADGAGTDEIELGVNPGWEAYGGIIRDVFLELRPSSFIENVRLAYRLAPPFEAAACQVTTFIDAAAPGPAAVRVALLDGEAEVASIERKVELPQGSSQVDVAFPLPEPILWSPDRPYLYRLVTELRTSSALDEFACMTGFRQVDVRGPDFFLNGSRIRLHGLSWLGTWQDQGFTLTRDQMQRDMRAMKAMGCNVVRLHLFPQDRRMVELADELGLLVSEEPGFWQVDFTTMRRSMIDLGLNILVRTIQRDWNSPAVFAWLLSNESQLTTTYLREGLELCKRLDPIGRLVSCANDHIPPGIKETFDTSGLDFYSAHPYDSDPDAFDRACEAFGTDKPLVFDEWGGRQVSDSAFTLQEQCNRILRLMDEGRLAGEMFFSWNDFRQLSRIDGEMSNGVCLSGLVSEARHVRRRRFDQVSRLFRGEPQSVDGQPAPVVIEPLKRVPRPSGRHDLPVDLQALVDGRDAAQAWRDLESLMAAHWEASRLTAGHWTRSGERLQFWPERALEIGGIGFQMAVADGHARPLVLTPSMPRVEIPVGWRCSRVHILGQVTLPVGYPVSGLAGETVAEYVVGYADGTTQRVPLRNGIEVASGNLIHQASRIAPEAAASPRALTFVRDAAREHYQALLFTIDTRGEAIESLVLSLAPEQREPLLLFGIATESP
jgi:Glycosyl hydrolases family 2, TIM barrel domain/Glycosyl hydrolases family 2/Glycosyl hydrolases family 2, sugar binding domain